jgi:hypothetical protein
VDAWNAVQAGILTLAAFVLGLSFSQASARFDARRGLVVKEANAIGTTWLRANQLQPPQTRSFRTVLVGYTAARLRAYQSPGNRALYARTIAQSSQEQAQLWSLASSDLRAHQTNLGLSLLLESLNDTIDVSAEQLQALKGHVPTAMVLFTLALVVLGALSTGVRFARQLAPSALECHLRRRQRGRHQHGRRLRSATDRTGHGRLRSAHSSVAVNANGTIDCFRSSGLFR